MDGNSKHTLYVMDKFFVEVECTLKLTRSLIRECINAIIPSIGIVMFLRRFECLINHSYKF